MMAKRLGMWSGEMNKQNTGDFYVLKHALYDIMMDICYFTFVQTHRMY